MIYPLTLYNFGKSCKDSIVAGNVLRALCKQAIELSDAEKAFCDMIANDSEWMDERIQAKRDKWKEQKRNQRGKFSKATKSDEKPESDVRTCPHLSANVRADKCVSTNVRRPSVPFRSVNNNNINKHNTIRSVDVKDIHNTRAREDGQTERNDNGTGLIVGGRENAKCKAAEFAKELAMDQGVFFTGKYDAVTICAALTDDYRSLRRWRQLVVKKGEAAIIEEAFRFYREITSGEDCKNRGAALNARLAQLPNQAKE